MSGTATPAFGGGGDTDRMTEVNCTLSEMNDKYLNIGVQINDLLIQLSSMQSEMMDASAADYELDRQALDLMSELRQV